MDTAKACPGAYSLRNEVIQLNQAIQRHDDADGAFVRLDTLLRTRTDEVCAACNIRWLISICDSYADHAPPAEAHAALAISTMLNMLRMAETWRFLSPGMRPQRVSRARADTFQLYGGVQTVHLDNQDTYLNLSRRLHRATAAYPHLGQVLDTILTRLHAEDSVLAGLAARSAHPERYLPVHPDEVVLPPRRRGRAA